MTTTPTSMRVLKEHDFDEPEVARGPYSGQTRALAEKLRSRLNVARELMIARVRRGLTQQQLADIAGTRQSRISELESVSGNPRFDTIDRAARALGLEVTLVRRESAVSIQGSFTRDLYTSFQQTLLADRDRDLFLSFGGEQASFFEHVRSVHVDEMMRRARDSWAAQEALEKEQLPELRRLFAGGPA